MKSQGLAHCLPKKFGLCQISSDNKKEGITFTILSFIRSILCYIDIITLFEMIES